MYNFQWEPQDGLKFIDDEKYEFACYLASTNVVRVEEEAYYYSREDGTQVGPRVKFVVNAVCFHSNDDAAYTTECSMKKCASQSNFPYLEVSIDMSPTGNLEFNTGLKNCNQCIYGGACIYPYAAYIRYLKDMGLEDRIVADREYYRVNSESIQQNYVFTYSIQDNLCLDVSKEDLEIAELLQKVGAVSACRGLDICGEVKDCMIMHTILDLNDAEIKYQELNEIRNKIKNNTLNWSQYNPIGIQLEHLKSLNAVYKGALVPAIAFYIDYLKKTGNYKKFLLNREKHIKETTEQFEKYCASVPEMKKVLAVAETDTNNSLYFIIEGERGVGKKKLVENIARYLNQKGKIHSSNYTCMTFDEIASSFGHHDLGDGINITTSENLHMTYKGFESHKLYVLTDLKEFLYQAEGHVDGDGSKYSHLIKVLGRYQSDTYIIIVGEKKYVDKFLKLSNSIQFNFGRNIVHLDNLSTNLLYDAYSQKLSENLKIQLNMEDGFKQKFIDYAEKNRRAMPLENDELASYLANYSNLQKKLELPPYVYQSKTAEEMLRDVIGMNNVKNTMAEFKKYAQFTKMARDEGIAVPNSNMHMIFTGNPGTGKTMIARVVGQVLYDLNLIEENKVVEIEPRQMISPYIGDSAKKTAGLVNQAMGGVLFIDEAYAIGNDTCGKEAIATLIKSMEDHKDKFVVIFAGYEKEMQEFLNINSGIASRIGYNFRFEDYNADELTRIYDIKMKNAGFDYDEKVLSAVKEVMSHFAGKKNFGNGRFVDKVIQKTLLLHALNENADTKKILEEDVPSIEKMITTDVIESTDIEEELAKFIGLSSVKEKVRQFAKYVEFQQAVRKRGVKIPAGNMHMVFTGNPGTGKTTIARVMVDLLYSIDVIKERKLIEVERKDLVGQYIGETAKKTTEVIERALNGVLFVDEAYSLCGEKGDFGGEAIATLIKAMEDHKDELIVIFAGYKDEMRSFLKINSGIESRIGYTFHFEDYNVEELLQIYMLRMNGMEFNVSNGAKEKIKNVCEYFCKKTNFGNGRFVGRLVQETLVKHSERVETDSEELMNISEADIPDIADLNNTSKNISSSQDLDQIIGMDGVKQKLLEFEDMVNFSIQAREVGVRIPDLNFHMLFTGNPGTGKTTIARIITEKLFDIGVVLENKLVEVERKDLIAAYVGQTAIKTSDVIEKALGGVLFIDEAYTLTPKSENDFGGEAIATLIKAMEDHKDDLIVIFAGYKDEMAEFVDSNPGIASRLGFTFHFDDYTPEQLVQIYLRKMKASGFEVLPEAEQELFSVMSVFSKEKDFGNGRFVDKVIHNTILKHAKRRLSQNLQIIEGCDIPTPEDMRNTMNQVKEERIIGFS